MFTIDFFVNCINKTYDKMTKEQLFKKYSIDDSHSKWTSTDSFVSVDIFRLMFNRLPTDEEEDSALYILEFLDKSKAEWWVKNVMVLPNWGSLFLTAKRMVYMFADNIILELNKQ
jgi:hypothetical protein